MYTIIFLNNCNQEYEIVNRKFFTCACACEQKTIMERSVLRPPVNMSLKEISLTKQTNPQLLWGGKGTLYIDFTGRLPLPCWPQNFSNVAVLGRRFSCRHGRPNYCEPVKSPGIIQWMPSKWASIQDTPAAAHICWTYSVISFMYANMF